MRTVDSHLAACLRLSGVSGISHADITRSAVRSPSLRTASNTLPAATMCGLLLAVPRCATLPGEPDPALAGIALAPAGELAVEAGEQPGVRPDGELGAGVDAHRVARCARTIDDEGRTRQRDEGGIDRPIGMELVHPRQPC